MTTDLKINSAHTIIPISQVNSVVAAPIVLSRSHSSFEPLNPLSGREITFDPFEAYFSSELYPILLDFLEPKDLFRLAQVSREWRERAHDTRLYVKLFPRSIPLDQLSHPFFLQMVRNPDKTIVDNLDNLLDFISDAIQKMRKQGANGKITLWLSPLDERTSAIFKVALSIHTHRHSKEFSVDHEILVLGEAIASDPTLNSSQNEEETQTLLLQEYTMNGKGITATVSSTDLDAGPKERAFRKQVELCLELSLQSNAVTPASKNPKVICFFIILALIALIAGALTAMKLSGQL